MKTTYYIIFLLIIVNISSTTTIYQPYNRLRNYELKPSDLRQTYTFKKLCDIYNNISLCLDLKILDLLSETKVCVNKTNEECKVDEQCDYNQRCNNRICKDIFEIGDVFKLSEEKKLLHERSGRLFELKDCREDKRLKKMEILQEEVIKLKFKRIE